MSIRTRSFRVTAATILFVVATLNSPPSIHSVPADRPEPPSLEEVAVLDELLEWLDVERGGFQAVRVEDVAGAIRSRERSFSLFRSLNGRNERLAALRGVPYAGLIERAAQKHSLDELLLAAVMEIESGFNPNAVSPVGALGLMQVMPSTAELFGYADPLNPVSNVDLGARYLSRMIRDFDGDLELALAAYNAGPGAVRRFDGVPPFRETRTYVKKVLGRYVDHHQSIWKQTGRDDYLVLEASSLARGS